MRQLKSPLLWVAVLCTLALLGSAPTQAEPRRQAGYQLNWIVVGGAGLTTMSGENQQMRLTAGQTATGWAENGEGLGSGFWYGQRPFQPAPTPSYPIHLPIVVKNYSSP